MRRLLITGASGFVGRHLEPRGFTEVHRPRVDLLEPDAAARLVAELRPTHLLHLAWFAEPGAFWSSPENTRWVEASLRLLREFVAAGGERAVLAGSCAEYDWGVGGRCHEERTPLAPATLYGASKHAVRLAGQALCAERGVSFAWGRVFFLHGPGEDPRRLLPSLARRMLAGEPAPMSHGRQVRDFLHVADVAGAFTALLDSRLEGALNIGSGEPHTLAELAALVARETGRPELLRVGALPAREGEPAELVADVGRLRGELGWRPSLSFAEGIADSVRSWR
ncbi:MAG: NAD(P)-dependent oxidoreductase [Solirubrobacteraceae bacterium]